MAKTYSTPSVASLGAAEILTLGVAKPKGKIETLNTLTTASMLDL